MDEKSGGCVAPGCPEKTPAQFHELCEGCSKCVEDAMLNARPLLLEAMVEERAEAEAWLASDWAPNRRWVIADEEFQEIPVDGIVDHMVSLTMEDLGWGNALGFVDDQLHARRVAWDREQDPKIGERQQVAWRIGSENERSRAWREHLGSLLRPALEKALSTAPLSWVGKEITAALTQIDGYDDDGAASAFEEIEEGTDRPSLSDGAFMYLDLRYYPHPAVIFTVDPASGWFDLWFRYAVLPGDIMAILKAVKGAYERRRQDSQRVLN